MRSVIIFIFCFVTISISAQRRTFLQEFSLGVNGGVNFSKVSFLHNDPMQSYELGSLGYILSPKLGLSARYISQNHFGVQIEINYLQSGWKEVFKSNDNLPTTINGVIFEGVEISRKLNY